ncbi:MAG: hypothetical protein K2Z81_19705, partial [Cyanobacteria bacterium]|nr:hypothetical protein [Cyanobacteriota bacterium]
TADGEKISIKLPGRVYGNLKGELTVDDNGTFSFSGKAHQWRSDCKGGLTGDFQQGQLKIRCQVDEQSVRFSQEVGGKYRLNHAHMQDGTSLIYTYDKKSGDVNFVFEERGNSIVEYIKLGDEWVRKCNGQEKRGALTLKDGVIPEFKERVADGSAEVSEAPEQRDLAHTFNMQQQLDTMLDSVWVSKYAEMTKEITTRLTKEHIDNWKSENKTPTAKDLKELDELIQDTCRMHHDCLQLELAELRQQLREEQEKVRNAKDINDVWNDCTATQKVYGLAVKWLQTEAVPGALKLGKGMGLDFQPGSPVTVPQEEGVFLVPDRFRTKATRGELKLDLRIDTKMPPGENDLKNMGKALRWMSDTQKFVDNKRQQHELETLLPDVFKKNRLPEEWLEEARKDPSKLPALRNMVDLSTKIRNYASAIKTLKLDQARVCEMPPYSNPHASDGKLDSLNMDLPKTLDMQDPDTLKKVEAWTKWLEVNGEKLDKALEEEARKFDPSRQVFFGEVEVKGVLYTSEDGKQEILDPKDANNAEKLASGRTQEFNMLDYGYKVNHKNGKIVMEMTVQPKLSRFYNYLNIGASDVGKPFTETKEYDPADPVAIRTSSGEVKIVRADELEALLSSQKFHHYGSKIVTATMDVGMLVAGGGTLCAAVKAGQLTMRVAVPAVVRAGLGGGGLLLNNAAVKTDPFWSNVETGRGVLMFVDVAQGTLRSIAGHSRGALRWLTGSKAAETISTAQKITAGLKEAEASWKWMAIWKTSQAVHKPMEMANIPFGVMLYGDMKGQIKHILGDKDDPNAGRLAAWMTKNGRELDKLPQTPEEIKHYINLSRSERLIDSYQELLTRGADAQKNQKIKDILDKTKLLLDPGQAEKCEQFKAELIENIYGSQRKIAEQIKARQLRENRVLSQDEIRTMTEKGFKADPDLKVASAVALLLLSESQKPTDVVATRSFEVPALSLTIAGSEKAPKGAIKVTFDTPKSVTQTVTREDIISFLKNDVTDSSNPARRMVEGDLLVRTGTRSPLSYASILRTTISNPKATSEERAAAILQLGPMVNSVQLLETAMESMPPEERTRLQAALSGNTSKELVEALQKVASSSEDKDLRALAGAVLNSIGQEYKAEELGNLIQAQAKEYYARKSSPGSYAEFFIKQVTLEREKPLSPAAQLNALLTLRALGDMGGMSDNKTFNTALVRTMSANRPDLAVLALRELKIDDPAKDLGTDNTQQILRVVDEKTTKENSELKIELARRIDRLAITKADKDLASSVFADMINSRRASFAKDFPEIRIAAIQAISKLNRQEHASLILDRTNPELETNAKVRAAAVKALKELQPPNLYEFALDALKKENDPNVRVLLLSIRQENKRPIRDLEYLTKMQELLNDLEKSEENNPEEGREWLDAKFKEGKFKLLNGKNYQEAREAKEKEIRAGWYLTDEGEDNDVDAELGKIVE